MTELLPTTTILYCSWLLSGESEEERSSIPSSDGILDQALERVVSSQQFPDWMREQLHFMDSNLGRACEELPQIQRLATDAKISSDPNPSYKRHNIVVGEPYAKRSLMQLGIDRKEAIAWGKALREAVEEAIAERSSN